MIYISLLYRYWKTHTKNLILIVFSGAFFFASIMVVFLLFRNKMSEKMNAWYDYKGAYNCSYVEGEYDEILNDYIDCSKKNAGNIEGRIYVTEKKSKNDMEYTCGYSDDKYNLAHIPMEDGRLPEKENEVAIDRIALENWGWLGEVGDTIVFDDGSRYVVSGIIDEQYGKRRRTEVCEWIEDYYNFGYEDLSKVKTFPLVYFYNDEKEPLYSIVMLGGIDRTASGEETQSIIDGLIEKCGMDYYKSFIEINQHFSDAKYFSKQNDITLDGNWALIIIGIASIIAVLSLASVLFVVKKEKKYNYETLFKIGMKKQRIYILDSVECIIVLVFESLVGSAIGVLSYKLVLFVKEKYLEISGTSGFSRDPNVIRTTRSPLLMSIIFTALATIITYVVSGFAALINKTNKKSIRKSNSSLNRSLFLVFSNKLVTAVQFTALYLACLGTLLGYVFFTSENKNLYNGLMAHRFESEEYLLPNGFDMAKDGIPEYYMTDGPGIVRTKTETGYGFGSAWYDFSRGIDDETADRLSSEAYMIGTLEQTMVITDKERRGLDYRILINEEAKEILKKNTKPEYQSFFDEKAENSFLYYVPTRLLNEGTINRLSECVVSGTIDIDKINSGEEILLVSSAAALFEAGEEIEIASALGNENGIGIQELTDRKVKIGAVLSVNSAAGKFLYYAARPDKSSENVITPGKLSANFITTVTGAKKLGLHNASYTEIIATEPLDGGEIPKSAKMTFMSLKKLKREDSIRKMTEVSGIAAVVVTMLIIGFVAYFGSIGLKIRNKAYEISVLRLLGESAAKIKKRIITGVIWIPVTACLMAGLTTKLVQKYVSDSYDYYSKKYVLTDARGITAEKMSQLYTEAKAYKDSHFLDSLLWDAHILKVMIYILIFVTFITLVGIVLALRKYSFNVIDTVNKERKRK